MTCSNAAIRPSMHTIRCSRRATRRAVGLGLRYNFCIVTEGRDTAYHTASARCDTTGARLRHGHDMAREGATIRPRGGHDTAQRAPRHYAGELRHAWQLAQHGAWQGLGSRYNFCIVIGRGDDTVGHGLRHDALCAMTRRLVRHDTVPSARCVLGLGVVHAQCARGLGQGVRTIHLTQF